MSEIPSSGAPGFRSGGVRAGRDIKADTINTGVELQGADAETTRELMQLAQRFESGGVEAVRDVIAKNINTGFRYIGQGGTEPTREQFLQELAALREQLSAAIQAGEIADRYDAEDAQRAVDRSIDEAQAPEPQADVISNQLDRVSNIITKTAKAAEAAGKLKEAFGKLVPVATGLAKLAGMLFL